MSIPQIYNAINMPIQNYKNTHEVVQKILQLTQPAKEENRHVHLEITCAKKIAEIIRDWHHELDKIKCKAVELVY
jgi:hypothetical protein